MQIPKSGPLQVCEVAVRLKVKPIFKAVTAEGENCTTNYARSTAIKNVRHAHFVERNVVRENVSAYAGRKYFTIT